MLARVLYIMRSPSTTLCLRCELKLCKATWREFAARSALCQKYINLAWWAKTGKIEVETNYIILNEDSMCARP